MSLRRRLCLLLKWLEGLEARECNTEESQVQAPLSLAIFQSFDL